LILLDTSGLYAALSPGQAAHERVRPILERERGPLILSPFVLAEVDHFLVRWEGVEAEAAWLREVAAGAYELVGFAADDVAEALGVIERYRDLRIGLADASLVVLAGRFGTERILTLDERHFRVLRAASGRPFTLLPADA
jgi:predicted nucleic acid-binding protein